MPDWDPEANELFLRALEIPGAEDRRQFLDTACAGNSSLRERVDALLRASEQAGSFLEHPAAEPGATRAHVPSTMDEAATPPVGLGATIGPYKLVQELGEGGMGTVYLAQQTEPVKRLVALKLVKPGMDSRQVLARFEAERQALALMDHPNIAKVLDAGATPDGRPYFVMELVKGTPITKYCDEHRLGVRDRLALFADTCRAIQHAHQKGITHRDIKPSNVLVAPYDGKPVVKVIDFGVAKAAGQPLTERTLVTGLGAVVGTPEYMSPEQAELNNADIDTRSDIYSLGVLLYELLTGTTPLTHKRLKDAALLEVLRVIREEEPPKPSTRLSTTEELPSIAAVRGVEPARLSKLVRGELDWIVMKALDKDRNRRYETANGFAMDILRYLADEPVQACPPSAGYRLRKFARRNKGTLISGALIASALVVALIVLAVSYVRIADETAEKSKALILAQENEKTANEQRLLAHENEKTANEQRGLAQTNERTANEQRRLAEANLMLILAALDDVYVTEAEKRFTAYQSDPNPRGKTRDAQLTQVDRDFLQKGLGFYEKLIQPGRAEPAARFHTGKAYRRVGMLQMQLKEYDKAADSLARAVALLSKLSEESPAESQYRSELSHAYRWQGGANENAQRPAEAEQAYQRAIALVDRLAAEFPTNVEYRVAAATWRMPRGMTLRLTDRTQESEAEYLQALKLWQQLVAEFPAERWYRHELAYTLDSLGWLLQNTAQPEKAEPYFRQALRYHEELVREDDTHADNRYRLARTWWSLAEVFASTNRLSEAAKVRREAVVVLEKLLLDFPANPHYAFWLTANYDALGRELTKAGQESDAKEVKLRAIKFFEKLAVVQANDNERREILARTQTNLANRLLQNDQKKEAANAYREAIAAWEKLATDFHDKSDYQEQVAACYRDLVGALESDGQYLPAERAQRGAVKLFQELTAAHPEPGIRDRLARSHHNLAELLLRIDEKKRAAKMFMLGEKKAAVQAFREAITIWEKLADDLPNKPEFPGHVTYTYGQLVALLIGDGQREELVKVFEQRIQFCKRLVAREPNQPEHKDRLQEAYRAHGRELLYADQTEQALAAYERAFSVAAELWRDFADKPPYFDRLTQSQADLAVALIQKRLFREGQTFYEQAIQRAPKDPVPLLSRVEFYCRLSLWDLAAQDYARAFELQPALSPSQAQGYAVLRLSVGDDAGYRRLCGLLPKQYATEVNYGDWENGLVRACALAAVPEFDLTWVVRRAEKFVRTQPNPWNCFALGLVRFRAGAFEAAVKELERSLGIDANWCRGGLNYSVLAMAYHKLGQREKAKEALEKAGAVMDDGLEALVRGPVGNPPMLWGDWMEICLLYREAKTLIDGAPPADDSRVHVARAAAFTALGDHKKATGACAKAVELSPRDAGLWYALGTTHYRAGEHAKAIEALTRALALRGANQDDFLVLAMAHWQSGQKDEARQWYSAALLRKKYGWPFRLNSEERDRLWRETATLVELDTASKLAEAEAKLNDAEVYTRILAKQSEAAWAYQLRGQIHRRLGNARQADADTHKAYQLLVSNLPAGPDALKQLQRAGGDSLRSNNWDMVILANSKALELKDDPWFYNERGFAYIALGQFREAARDYTKVIEANPQRASAYARRGYSYLRCGERDKASADYAKVVKLYVNFNGDGWSRYCALKLGAGLGQLNDEKAVADFWKVAELGPNSAFAWGTVAWLLVDASDATCRHPEKAIEFAKKGVELAPNARFSWNALGFVYYRAGKWDDAVAALEKAMELSQGGDGYDWFFLSMAHWQLGDKEKARKWYDKAAQWMDKNRPGDEDLRPFRTEAAELLGIKDGKK
jgi:serine/threonine protein kinase/tetratricopeptide (TPR) repeat protein